MSAESQSLPPVAGAPPAPAPAPAASVEPVRKALPVGAHRDRADLEGALRDAARRRHGDRDVAITLGHDEASGHVVVRVRDRATGEVVGQYPPEELLRFYAMSREQLGPIVDVTS